jgi:hypothetical protein
MLLIALSETSSKNMENLAYWLVTQQEAGWRARV